ncbi:hypothetical protein FCV25MIE_30845 [Fagus crenata]
MKRELLIWLFLIVSLKVLSSSACAEDNSSCERETQLTHLYETKYAGHHLRTFQKGKAVYGGNSNINRPQPRRSGANSLLVKSSSLFSVALRHAVLGLLVSVFFF